MSQTSSNLDLLREAENMLSGRPFSMQSTRDPTKVTIGKHEADIGVVAFWAGDHQSHVASSSINTLVLSKNTRGKLYAEFNNTRHEGMVVPNTVTFVPAHTQQFYDFEGQTNNIVIKLDQRVMRRVGDMDTGLTCTGLEPRLHWVRPRLNALVNDVFRLLSGDDLGWRTLTESCAMQMAVEILSAQLQEKGNKRKRHRLSPQQLATLVEFVRAHLDENFGVSDMAQVLNLDQFTFTRSFKATTGETPHRFVVGERVAQAQELLCDKNTSLADIAYACGFSSQQHMTQVFTARTGMTPHRYRKTLRN